MGSPLVYAKRVAGIAIQETKAAPEMRLQIEQWQFAEGYLSGLKRYRTEPQKHPPSISLLTFPDYSTVTLLARLRGWSTSVPR